jgi:hypothetical protein
LIITDLTQSITEEPPSYDSLYESIPEPLMDLKEPLPCTPIAEQVIIPPAIEPPPPQPSVSTKFFRMWNNFTKICNEKAKDVDAALTSWDRRWGITETVDTIAFRYGISEAVDSVSRDFNEATVSFGETVKEVSKALSETILGSTAAVEERESEQTRLPELPEVPRVRSPAMTCAQSD